MRRLFLFLALVCLVVTGLILFFRVRRNQADTMALVDSLAHQLADAKPTPAAAPAPAVVVPTPSPVVLPANLITAEQLEHRLLALATVSPAAMQGYVDTYLAANPQSGSLMPMIVEANCLLVASGIGKVATVTLPVTPIGQVSVWIGADGPYVVGQLTDEFFFSADNGVTAKTGEQGDSLFVNVAPGAFGYPIDATDTIHLEFFKQVNS